MGVFSDYLDELPLDDQAALTALIELVRGYVPEAVEGLSYGLPAFRYRDRPLIGFGARKEGLSLYPFDPRLIDEVRSQLEGFELGRGVIRFTADQPLPETVIVLLLDRRVNYLDGQSRR